GLLPHTQMNGETPNDVEIEAAVQLQGRGVGGIDRDFNGAATGTFRQCQAVVQDGAADPPSAGFGDHSQVGDFPGVAFGMFGENQNTDIAPGGAVNPPGVRDELASGT